MTPNHTMSTGNRSRQIREREGYGGSGKARRTEFQAQPRQRRGGIRNPVTNGRSGENPIGNSATNSIKKNNKGEVKNYPAEGTNAAKNLRGKKGEGRKQSFRRE